MQVNFVTTNKMKFDIARAYFDKLPKQITLVQNALDTPEIQHESVLEIARESALWAARRTGKPSIKLDAGFYIAALNGFPGPFVKYINEWLSQEDLLRLMESKSDRAAYFEDAIAIGYPDGSSRVFAMKHHGSISKKKDPANERWPANLLFIPDGYDEALGSMSEEDQNEYWGDGNWPAVVEHLRATETYS